MDAGVGHVFDVARDDGHAMGEGRRRDLGVEVWPREPETIRLPFDVTPGQSGFAVERDDVFTIGFEDVG